MYNQDMPTSSRSMDREEKQGTPDTGALYRLRRNHTAGKSMQWKTLAGKRQWEYMLSASIPRGEKSGPETESNIR
jgi:hypothetical protein